MIFTPSNVDDIRRYYEKTYCKLKEFGDRLFFFEAVNCNEDGWQIVLKDSNNDYVTISLEEEAPYNMDFALPHKAMFPFKNTVFMLQRIPARQYKRGICPDNTQIIDIFSNKPVILEFKKLEMFINKPGYVSLNEALYGKTGSTVVGVAMGPRLAFNKVMQVAYVDCTPVAQFSRTTNKMGPIEGGSAALYELFKPELMSVLDVHYEKQPEFR